MARVYSASQGKFIETSTAGSVQPVETNTSMTSLGVPDEKIRNAFFKIGVAKPDLASSLNTLYGLVKPEGETAEMKNRKQSLRPAESALSRIDDAWLSGLGPQNKFAEVSLRNLGGLFVDKKLYDLDSKFQLLKQNVVRALQGARMSDADIKLAKSYVPSISDTPDYARIKIQNLKQFIGDLQNREVSNSDTQVSSPWEVVSK